MARALRDLRASCCGKLMTKSKHVRCPCVAPAVSLIPIGMVVVPVISYVGFAQNKHRLDHSATGCSMKHAFHIRIELRTVPPRGTPLKKGYHIWIRKLALSVSCMWRQRFLNSRASTMWTIVVLGLALSCVFLLASLLLVAMPLFVTSSFLLLVVWPGGTSRFLLPQPLDHVNQLWPASMTHSMSRVRRAHSESYSAIQL